MPRVCPVAACRMVRCLGWRWAAFRVRYALRRKLGGLQRRLAAGRWEDEPAVGFDPGEAAFFFEPGFNARRAALLRRLDGAEQAWTGRRLDAIGTGRVRYFNGGEVEAGWPPRWHVNPITGVGAPDVGHFSRVDQFAFGDIKAVWEINRFAFAHDLARIGQRANDPRAAELFWRAVADWRDRNPPNTGVNWNCGQEATVRAMAWCVGLFAFLNSAPTTAAHVAMLARMLAVTARRIAGNLDYALSQHNNHGIAEANGLWTIGLLLPRHPDAARWRHIGQKALETQARTLIYDDGGFSQHAANYHRVMLQHYLWAIRLGELNHQPLSEATRDRVRAACRFLLQVQDRVSGSVPRFGQDDGALVLPWSNCDYFDFRPVAQAAAYFAHRRLVFEPGPWDEETLWLYGEEALQSPRGGVEQAAAFTGPGGCHVLRGEEGFVLGRCADFVHRPSQMDQLHVDVWWKGVNVALDGGTYSYNGEGRWADVPLGEARYHNTVTVDGRDQSDRAARFMHLPWPRGRAAVSRSSGGAVSVLRMRHEGYRRLRDPVTHERVVVGLAGSCWVVVDRLVGRREHVYRLHWLLAQAEHTWDAEAGRVALRYPAGAYEVRVMTMEASAQATLVSGDGDSCRGWRSPYYLRIEPALSLAVVARSRSVRFVSILSPPGVTVQPMNEGMELAGAWGRARLVLGVEANEPLVRQVALDGSSGDEWNGDGCVCC